MSWLIFKEKTDSDSGYPLEVEEYSDYDRAHETIHDLMRNEPSNSILLPSSLASIKGIFFDMDDTLLEGESLVHLAQQLGKHQEIEVLTQDAMTGKIDFRSSLERRLSLFQGHRLEEFRNITGNFKLHPHAEDVLCFLKKMGISVYLVSGGFFEWIPRSLLDIGFSGICINKLKLNHDGYIDGPGYLEPIVDGKAKAQYVESMMTKNGWKKHNVVAVGDGANDLSMMQKCLYSIGIKPKPILHQQITGMIRTDYGFLLKVLNTF